MFSVTTCGTYEDDEIEVVWMKDKINRLLSSTPFIVIFFLIISFIVVNVIPGDIHTIVSDWIGIEGSGKIVNLLAVFIVLVLAYNLITLAHAKRDEIKVNLDPVATTEFQTNVDDKKIRGVYIHVNDYIKNRYTNEIREIYSDPRNQAGVVSSELFRLDKYVEDELIKIGHMDDGDRTLIADLNEFCRNTETIMERNRRIEQSNKLYPIRKQMIEKLDYKLLHMNELYGINETNSDIVYRYLYVESINSGHIGFTVGTPSDGRWFTLEMIAANCNLSEEEAKDACQHHPEIRKQKPDEWGVPLQTIERWGVRKFIDR